MSELINRCFLGKTVVVESFGFRVEGKLVSFSNSSKKPTHSPDLLVLESQEGSRQIVRGWSKMMTAAEVVGK